ncbi:YitT family protein [Liquorilactobacillus satsumensis]|uniref:YitT family protein n=1 Tax=Liquorilactobacillus satsumensis TaxID=259059 RepID=UPI000704E411|nr:YitT family protein [Liquorilactobacillus satsumensis]MCP9312333.1 YitT family protein [Liquorilactobacillus satsumensis]MCP9327692.1 YitT family protein [Liquorilactobacillus satsumensis]MCP9357037.1 YitT family protein [Liquorilactobacillus satsumensis]MCP9359663.1 YitT family protein [Liquorilactobacillus satsumensis]MCP9370984.1 YitT family protein [Liquorilactobacillus satsumensis]
MQYSNGLRRFIIVIFAGAALALGLNFFLLPGNIFGAGLNGIAQLVSAILKKTIGIKVDTGYFIFLLNVPVALLGFLKIGKSFTFYSILTVLSTTILTILLPVQRLTADPLMNALFGGVITGVGVGYSLKYGFSTGGMDIVAVFLNKTTGRSVGFLMLATNMIIILTAGFYFSWQSALYTIISNYALTRVVDSIHTSHQKITAFVVTAKAAAILPVIQHTLVRGVTVLPSKGAYSGKESQTLMTVLTRYELYRFKQLVSQEDPTAFINFVNTADIAGNFADSTQQEQIKAKVSDR